MHRHTVTHTNISRDKESCQHENINHQWETGANFKVSTWILRLSWVSLTKTNTECTVQKMHVCCLLPVLLLLSLLINNVPRPETRHTLTLLNVAHLYS